MKLGLALVAVKALEEVFIHQGWEIDAAPWSRSQSEVNQPVLLLTSRRSHIYVAVPDSLGPTHSKKWTVTICRRLGETLAGRWSPEQLTDQHLTPAPADAGWTRNSWSQSGAPQRQVAPVPYPLSLYTTRTLWMPHNSSPPPNLSPRFAFGRSFPRWMLVFSQRRPRFFDQKMCPASRWYFLNKHSIFFFHCSDTTLLERDQSGLSCHCFLIGLLINEKIGNSLTFHSLLITEKHFEIPFIVLLL